MAKVKRKSALRNANEVGPGIDERVERGVDRVLAAPAKVEGLCARSVSPSPCSVEMRVPRPASADCLQWNGGASRSRLSPRGSRSAGVSIIQEAHAARRTAELALVDTAKRELASAARLATGSQRAHVHAEHRCGDDTLRGEALHERRSCVVPGDDIEARIRGAHADCEVDGVSTIVQRSGCEKEAERNVRRALTDSAQWLCDLEAFCVISSTNKCRRCSHATNGDAVDVGRAGGPSLAVTLQERQLAFRAEHFAHTLHRRSR